MYLTMLGAYSVSPERGVVEPSKLGLEAYCIFRLDRPGWLEFETGGANEMRRVIMFKACCDFSGFDDLSDRSGVRIKHKCEWEWDDANDKCYLRSEERYRREREIKWLS